MADAGTTNLLVREFKKSRAPSPKNLPSFINLIYISFDHENNFNLTVSNANGYRILDTYQSVRNSYLSREQLDRMMRVLTVSYFSFLYSVQFCLFNITCHFYYLKSEIKKFKLCFWYDGSLIIIIDSITGEGHGSAGPKHPMVQQILREMILGLSTLEAGHSIEFLF